MLVNTWEFDPPYYWYFYSELLLFEFCFTRVHVGVRYDTGENLLGRKWINMGNCGGQ